MTVLQEDAVKKERERERKKDVNQRKNQEENINNYDFND
jgi:hypothetical protein